MPNTSSYSQPRPGAPLRLASPEPATKCATAADSGFRGRSQPSSPTLTRSYGQGLFSLLESEDDMTVVAEAATGEQALAAPRRLHPDALILDAALPPAALVEAARAVTAESSLTPTSVVMVSRSGDDDWILDALRAGGHGFVVKDADASELGDVVGTVDAATGCWPGLSRDA